MPLRLVCIQLALFPDLERRSGGQWLRSIKDYLEFQAGCAWRRSTERSSSKYLYYLDALRFLNGIGCETEASPSIRVVTPRTALDVHIAALAGNGRGWLVDHLMRANPALTDRKLISHFQNSKLARMLIAAQARRQAERVA
jgi:hypothetical protein